MNKKEAEKFVTETFQNSYDDDRYLRFIKELLNGERLQYGSLDYKHPPSSYKDYISEYRIFGLYHAPHSKRILFVAVKLSKSKSLDRARVMQRNFAAEILRGKISKAYNANAALIAFYGDEKEDWRLSFVTLDTELVCGDRGLCVSETLSPAKRFSYLVGVHEPCHTCMKRFCPLIEDEKNQLTVDQLLDVFHVEKVSDEFFKEYKKCYLHLTRSLQDVVDHDIAVKTEFENKNLVVADFTKKLLGQIVFLYFLQKKGWLGVKRDENWGSGPKDFMQQLFQKKIVPYDNFFDDILEPLFYEALARKNDYDYYSRFNVRIPFLNGGLFEAEYDWVHTNIVIENSVFEKIFETFDRYNFTVKEDEPLEKEVAVDPEMLGKVFERLLEEDARKSNGAVYTPRFIVHYICQQSLIEYLERHTDIPRNDIEFFIQKGDELYAKTLQKVIDAESGRENKSADGLPESIVSHALEIDTLLRDIKIADPAVGSGAFPVGMMNEIVKARTALTPRLNRGDESRTAYNLKRQTIENSIYGVDLDPSAVDISKLRFWLSLIVDEVNPKEIRPLPNLDHKIVAGNSLLESFQGIKLFDDEILSPELDSAAEEVAEIDNELKRLREERDALPWGTESARSLCLTDEINRLENRKARILKDEPQKQILQTLSPVKVERFKKSRKGLKEYRILQNQYFNEQDKEKKAELRKEIERQEWDIIEREADNSGNPKIVKELKTLKGKKGKPFFLWKLYFSEVFTRENPGFDCVIGNPPYIQLQKLDKNVKKQYEQTGFSVHDSMGDICCLFYEKGWTLLRDGGTLGYITTNGWMRGGYGENLRDFFVTKTNPILLIDFPSKKIFEGVTVEANILLYNKEPNQKKTKACAITVNCSENMSDLIQQQAMYMNFDTKESWIIQSPIEKQIKEKVDKIGVPLKDWNIKINFGIKTGYNPAFIINGETRTNILNGCKTPDERTRTDALIRPILRGRDISRYTSTFSDLWIISTFPSRKYDIEEYPAVKHHLLQFGIERLEQTGKEYVINGTKIKARKKTHNKWFETQDSISYWEDFSKQKIVWGEISDRPKFVLDEEGKYYAEATTFIMTGDISLKYLLAFLNSKYSEYMFSKIGTTTGMGTTRWKKFKILELPIPVLSPNDEIKYTHIVDSIMHNRKNNLPTDTLERKIDSMIYELFKFTEDEIKIIEGFMENVS